jgi:hypothetical protein
MGAGMAEQLHSIVTALDAHMELLRGCGFEETVALLAMAKLDLQMKIYGISDEELRELCTYIEAQKHQHDNGERAIPSVGSVIDLADRVRK